MNEVGPIFVTAVVFYGIYQIIALLSDYFLKRKLIKSGQYEKVGILEPIKRTSDEVNKYPSLKWGLVALMTGIGFILIQLFGLLDKEWIEGRDTVLPFGILLVSISLGFLIYFFIVNSIKKN